MPKMTSIETILERAKRMSPQMNRVRVALLAFLATACTSSLGNRAQPIVAPEGAVSVRELYEGAAQFDGKRVVVIGFAAYDANPFDALGGHIVVYPGDNRTSATDTPLCINPAAPGVELLVLPSGIDEKIETQLSEGSESSVSPPLRQVLIEGDFHFATKEVRWNLLVQNFDASLDNARVLEVSNFRCGSF
jgi:hypothetical protein